MLITDKPENIAIVPDENSLQVQVNTTFICYADSNPVANYTWLRIVGSGPDVINGPHLFTETSMAGGNEYKCIVENSIGKIDRNVNFSVGKQRPLNYCWHFS